MKEATVALGLAVVFFKDVSFDRNGTRGVLVAGVVSMIVLRFIVVMVIVAMVRCVTVGMGMFVLVCVVMATLMR